MQTCARDGCRRWHGRFVHRAPGVTMDGWWYCSPDCVRLVTEVRLSAAPSGQPLLLEDPLRMRLGSWLRHNGAITAPQLVIAMAEQALTGARLGEIVCRLGFCTEEAVLRALAQQSGVPYLSKLDAALVRRGPGGLSPHAVRALQVVPFAEPIDGRIKVATAAPVRWAMLSAFRQITGFAPQPHLITDALACELVSAYGADMDTLRQPHFHLAADVSDAAATIARAAGRIARVVEARCDPFTWVRVSAESGVHDVVLATGAGA